MKYLIQDETGKEYGPIDEETLRKWTEAGRVVPHTPVRNILIKKWNKASDLDFLLPSFAVQSVREEDEKNVFRKFSDHLNTLFGGGKEKKKEETPWATAFKNKYIHDPATVPLRIVAFAFDLVLIGAFSMFLMAHFSASFTHPPKPVHKEVTAPDAQTPPTDSPAEAASAKPSEGTATEATSPVPTADGNAKSAPAAQTSQEVTAPTPESIAEVNSAFNRFFYILMISVLLYYSLSLGIFAQTFGMWFWGLMIAKPDLGEVLFGRAYFFTVLMLFIGILSPIIVFFNPYKRSLHELLSGTMVIKTAARPKA